VAFKVRRTYAETDIRWSEHKRNLYGTYRRTDKYTCKWSSWVPQAVHIKWCLKRFHLYLNIIFITSS
jgi:hypothetical protein